MNRKVQRWMAEFEAHWRRFDWWDERWREEFIWWWEEFIEEMIELHGEPTRTTPLSYPAACWPEEEDSDWWDSDCEDSEDSDDEDRQRDPFRHWLN